MSGWNNKDTKPVFLDHNMNSGTYPANSNIYVVDDDRITKSGPIGEAVTHQGWVQVKPGKGSITNITTNNYDKSKTYVDDTFVFTGANTNPASATFGKDGKITIKDGGAGYDDSVTLKLSDPDANNKALTFTVTGSGRFGRNQVETIVALSEPNTTTITGSPYFKD